MNLSQAVLVTCLQNRRSIWQMLPQRLKKFREWSVTRLHTKGKQREKSALSKRHLLQVSRKKPSTQLNHVGRCHEDTSCRGFVLLCLPLQATHRPALAQQIWFVSVINTILNTSWPYASYQQVKSAPFLVWPIASASEPLEAGSIYNREIENVWIRCTLSLVLMTGFLTCFCSGVLRQRRGCGARVNASSIFKGWRIIWVSSGRRLQAHQLSRCSKHTESKRSRRRLQAAVLSHRLRGERVLTE